MQSVTRTLAKFVAELRFEDIPKEVTEKIKSHILDTLGVSIFGSTTHWSKILTDVIRELGEKKEASVWGCDLKTSCINAALANSTFAHGFELDDLHRYTVTHPGPVSVPPALAVAERLGGVSGKDFITAAVTGYETCIRVGMSLGPGHFHRGFHPVGTLGTFGATAASSKVLQLDEDKTMHAFGIAASQAAGLMAAQYGAMVKRLHAGRAAQSGVLSALLAEKGFTGIIDVLELAWGGFCSTMTDRYDLTMITAGLGEEWETLRCGFKAYASAASTHTSIDAIKNIMNKYSITSDMIAKVNVSSTTMTKVHCGYKYKPKGTVGAQMSIPYCVAVQLLEGDVFVNQFTDDKLADPRILDLIKKINVIPNKELDALGHAYRHSIIMDVYLKDGRTYNSGRIDYRKGSPENSMTREEVLGKFNRLAMKILKKEKVEEIVRTVDHLEEVDNVTSLIDLLRL